jgi:hypothetical protein
LKKTSAQIQKTGDHREEELEWNYFKSAQWSPDGTSLITNSADNKIRTFILPPDLLDPHEPPIALTPYQVHANPSPVNCLVPYPAYNLSDPNTTLYLSAPSNLPIRLTNSLSPSSTPTAAYPFVSPTTEGYYTPSSLLWTSPSTFLTGTDCLIALFDVSRNGSGPTQSLPTIPSKRHKMKGGGVGIRGIISALSLQPSPGEETEVGMVAAGTWTRWIGLYDMAGVGGTVAQWSVAEAADSIAGIGGMGVSQTAWSACGRYLYVVERKSNGVLVYDIRGTRKMLAWLEGRQAVTNQRLGVDTFQADGSTEIWAGGMDGVVRVWEGVGMSEGKMERSWEWKAHDGKTFSSKLFAVYTDFSLYPVTSTVVHSSGTVVATCSGQRSPNVVGDDRSESDSDSDSSTEESDSDTDSESNSISSSSDTSGSQSGISNSSSALFSRTPDNSIKVWKL